MVEVGAGGIRFSRISYKKRFKKEYRRLDPQLQARVNEKLADLLSNPFPPGLRFEKLQGHSDPAVFTIHVDGNYKISLEAENAFDEDGCEAVLRRVATHNEIDRRP